MSKSLKKKAVLTKNSAKEFSKYLYHKSGNQVSYTSLCEGDLKEGKLHCVIGEAYHTFVNTSLRGVMRVSDDRVSEFDTTDGPTGAAIDALVEVANINKNSSKGKLAFALKKCVHANDSSYEEDVVRAREASKAWMTYVVPLLK